MCWEVSPVDRKICNNRRCARHRRPIRIAAAAMEDCRRPVVNLVRSPILFYVYYYYYLRTTVHEVYLDIRYI